MSKRPPSRPARWAKAVSDATSALEVLVELRQEYEDWKDNLPENLQQSALGEKLDTVCDLDFDGALSTVQDAESVDLPMGFGKD